ncbi:MAG: hypothetical protein AAFW83_14630 [Pseudomonadota bacterium]
MRFLRAGGGRCGRIAGAEGQAPLLRGTPANYSSIARQELRMDTVYGQLAVMNYINRRSSMTMKTLIGKIALAACGAAGLVMTVSIAAQAQSVEDLRRAGEVLATRDGTAAQDKNCNCPKERWVSGKVTSYTTQHPAFTVFLINRTAVQICDLVSGDGLPVDATHIFFQSLQTAMINDLPVETYVRSFGNDPRTGDEKLCIDRVVVSR